MAKIIQFTDITKHHTANIENEALNKFGAILMSNNEFLIPDVAFFSGSSETKQVVKIGKIKTLFHEDVLKALDNLLSNDEEDDILGIYSVLDTDGEERINVVNMATNKEITLNISGDFKNPTERKYITALIANNISKENVCVRALLFYSFEEMENMLKKSH